MSKEVLIAYATRYGSTEEISMKFKQALEDKGFTVDLVNLKAKHRKKITISDYSGVLIGGSIRIGRLTKETKKFLKKNADVINNSRMITGVFLCSGEAADPEKRPAAIDKYLIKVFDEVGLNLDERLLYDAFGGVFDLSNTSNLSWMMKKMLNMAAEDDPNLVRGERHDMRDWDQIGRFVSEFMRKLEQDENS